MVNERRTFRNSPVYCHPLAWTDHDNITDQYILGRDYQFVAITKDARRLLAGLVAAVLLLAASAADAALTTDKCLVSKRKAWTALRKCQGTEEAKKLLGKAADFAKCDTKFQEKLAQIDDKATDAGIACRYAHNGDGTVTRTIEVTAPDGTKSTRTETVKVEITKP